MATLRQPWKIYLEQKEDIMSRAASEAQDFQPGLDTSSEELCPGGPDCYNTRHALGATKHCAFNNKIEVPSGPTGTSG